MFYLNKVACCELLNQKQGLWQNIILPVCKEHTRWSHSLSPDTHNKKKKDIWLEII